MACVRPACASCSSLLFIAMAIFALAAVAKGAGEPDPDSEHIKAGPADCPMECVTKLTGGIMETVKCYIGCMGGGGGGKVFAFAPVAKGAGEPGRPDTEHVGASPFDCPMECATKLTTMIMETVKCYIGCMGGGGGGGGGELSAVVEEEARGSCHA